MKLPKVVPFLIEDELMGLGDCALALVDLNAMYREVFGREKRPSASRSL